MLQKNTVWILGFNSETESTLRFILSPFNSEINQVLYYLVIDKDIGTRFVLETCDEIHSFAVFQGRKGNFFPIICGGKDCIFIAPFRPCVVKEDIAELDFIRLAKQRTPRCPALAQNRYAPAVPHPSSAQESSPSGTVDHHHCLALKR